MDKILASLELPLYRFLLRLSRDPDIAADLTQETLLRAWKNRSKVRDQRATRVWVFRIAVNLWSDRGRSTANRPSNDGWEDESSREPNPADLAAANELGRAVWEAIDHLPEKQKQVMHLRVLEQMEPKEISETLNLDPALVRSNLSAARRRLRQLLGDHIAVATSPGKPS